MLPQLLRRQQRLCSSVTSSLLDTLHAAPAGTLKEAKALRKLWRHLQAAPPTESPCASCDCGEPCEDPVTEWSLVDADDETRRRWKHGAQHRVSVQRDHELALENAPAPLDSSATHAETPFTAASAALLRAAWAYPREPSDRKLLFADLGSGVGRPALTAAILGDAYSAVLGWEQQEQLHGVSVSALGAMRSKRGGGVVPDVRLMHGDAAADGASSTWRNSDVVLFHAPLDGHFAHVVGQAAHALKPGSVLLTVGGILPGTPSHFQLLERRRLPFSWGMGTLFVSRRLDDTRHDDPDFGGLAGAHDDGSDTQLLRDDVRGLARVMDAIRSHSSSNVVDVSHPQVV